MLAVGSSGAQGWELWGWGMWASSEDRRVGSVIQQHDWDLTL